VVIGDTYCKQAQPIVRNSVGCSNFSALVDRDTGFAETHHQAIYLKQSFATWSFGGTARMSDPRGTCSTCQQVDFRTARR
jgi:hypothetical protein